MSQMARRPRGRAFRGLSRSESLGAETRATGAPTARAILYGGAMRGATLLEMLAVLVVIAVMTAVALPPLHRALDQAAVRAAADRYATLFEAARDLALRRARLVQLTVDTARVEATMTMRQSGGRWDTVRTWALGEAQLATSQPSVAFAPIGIGFGLSNSRLVFSRGAAAETLTVSRTGRLKRW